MTQDWASPTEKTPPSPQSRFAATYYGLLGLHPSASAREIRQSYRDLSKLYHPDTTTLTPAVATRKFQQLNEAYATLSSPERRAIYDQKIGYSRVAVVHSLPSLQNSRVFSPVSSSSSYLDPTDRPLSPGELFALFILGLTFVACLVLAIAIGVSRGESIMQTVAQSYRQAPIVRLNSGSEQSATLAPAPDPVLNPLLPTESSSSFPLVVDSEKSEAQTQEMVGATSPQALGVTE